jgi:U4/U6 small nuclear ribonucleoprotein PRP3
VPKSETKEVPNVEWWDALILKNSDNYDVSELRVEAITNLIEHPIQMKPLEAITPNQVPVFLTKREMKKLRRQNRREAWKEKQDKIRLGMIQPGIRLVFFVKVV